MIQNTKKRALVWLLVGSSVACGSRNLESDSRTSWLVCDVDEDCPSGQGCVTGRCGDPAAESPTSEGGETGSAGSLGSLGSGGPNEPGGQPQGDEADAGAASGILYSFTDDDEGFGFVDYAPADLRNLNLFLGCDSEVASPLPDAGTNLCEATRLTQVRETGVDPEAAPGLLKWEGPYSGYDQYLDMQKSFADDAVQDWSGRLVRAKVRVAADGFNPSPSIAPGGGYIYVQTGSDWGFARGPWVDFEHPGQWIELTIDLDYPDNYDPDGTYDATQVRAIGVQISTGSNSADNPLTEVPSPAVFYIDEFTIEPNASEP